MWFFETIYNFKKFKQKTKNQKLNIAILNHIKIYKNQFWW